MKKLSVIICVGILIFGVSVAKAGPFDDVAIDQVREIDTEKPAKIKPPVVITPPKSGETKILPPPPAGDITIKPVDKPKSEPKKVESEPKRKVIKIKVKAGDTLWSIAKKYLGDGSKFVKIIEANKDKFPTLVKNPNLIFEGWELVIPGEEPARSESGSVKPDNSQAASQTDKPSKPVEKNYTTAEKIRILQGAVDAFNAELKKSGKQLTELNEETVLLMIQKGYIKGHREWLALNPPLGYRWVLKDGKVTLVSSSEKVEPAPKPPEKPKVDEKKAETMAERNFNADLAKIGVPNLAGKEKAYYDAVDSLSKLLPGKMISYSGPDDIPQNRFHGGFYDLVALQKSLKDAHKLYEEMVQKKDTDRFLGIFGDNIESAAKKVQEAREKLSKAYTELKSLYNEGKAKADKASAEIAKLQAENKDIEKKYDQLKENPDNGKELQKLAETFKKNNEKIKDLQEDVKLFEPIKGVFGK